MGTLTTIMGLVITGRKIGWEPFAESRKEKENVWNMGLSALMPDFWETPLQKGCMELKDLFLQAYT